MVSVETTIIIMIEDLNASSIALQSPMECSIWVPRVGGKRRAERCDGCCILNVHGYNIGNCAYCQTNAITCQRTECSVPDNPPKPCDDFRVIATHIDDSLECPERYCCAMTNQSATVDGQAIEYEITGREAKTYQVMTINAVLMKDAKRIPYMQSNEKELKIFFGIADDQPLQYTMKLNDPTLFFSTLYTRCLRRSRTVQSTQVKYLIHTTPAYRPLVATSEEGLPHLSRYSLLPQHTHR